MYQAYIRNYWCYLCQSLVKSNRRKSAHLSAYQFSQNNIITDAITSAHATENKRFCVVHQYRRGGQSPAMRLIHTYQKKPPGCRVNTSFTIFYQLNVIRVILYQLLLVVRIIENLLAADSGTWHLNEFLCRNQYNNYLATPPMVMYQSYASSMNSFFLVLMHLYHMCIHHNSRLKAPSVLCVPSQSGSVLFPYFCPHLQFSTLCYYLTKKYSFVHQLYTDTLLSMAGQWCIQRGLKSMVIFIITDNVPFYVQRPATDPFTSYHL